MLKKRLIYVLWSMIVAFSFFLFSHGFIFQFVAERNVLQATILNSAVIIFFLILGKIKLPNEAESLSKKERFHLIKKILVSSNNISMKSGLYLFYIVILILTGILMAEPSIA